MNGVAFWFAGGDGFFLGAALVFLAADVLIVGRKHFRLAARLLAIVGAILVALSATPLAVWLYVVWGVCVAALIVMPIGRSESKLRRILPAAAVGLVTVVAIAIELPWHFTPSLEGPRPERLVIIGDSITAGLGIGETTWPALLREKAGIQVRDLSEPGLATASALVKLEGVGADVFEGAVVVVELGGNDMLSFGVSADEYRENLDRLLAAVSTGASNVIVLELPLPPFHNRFGAAQRDIARKHGALLVPKRRCARILGRTGNTVDGLHLSQEGHERMAEMLLEIIPAGEGR